MPNDPVAELEKQYAYSDPEDAPEEPVEGEDAVTPEETGVETEDKDAVEEKPVEKEPAPGGISPEVLARAISAGISPAEAQVFTNDKDLLTATYLLEQRTPKQEEQDEDQFRPYELKLDGESLDEESLAREMKAMNEHYAAQVKVLRESQQAIAAQTQQSSQVNDAMQWFDAQIGELGPEWEPVFGKGPTAALSATSEERDRRQKTIDTIVGIASTRNDLEPEQIFALATAQYGSLTKKADDNHQQEKAVARPNHATAERRGVTFQEDEAKAMAELKALHRRFLRENGEL